MLIALGIVLAMLGGATLALAMVTQRYALAAHSSDADPLTVPFIAGRWKRNYVWFVGLVLYGVANGIYAASLLYGPLSLLAGVFTTLLVFNMIFARLLLGEVITLPKAAGAVLILAGVVVCIVVAPISTASVDLTPRAVEALAVLPEGIAYLVILLGAVLVSVVAILWVKGQADVPRRLERVMAVLAPASLGLDEGIAHLTMKGWIGMVDSCRDVGECQRPIIYIFILVWAVSSVATLWWLRTVFRKYEATAALPIEYGTVNGVSACSGLIFYLEYKSMSQNELILTFFGLVLIFAGITVGQAWERPAAADTEEPESIAVHNRTGSSADDAAPRMKMLQSSARISPISNPAGSAKSSRSTTAS
ncbi:hypothetical protein T492DRAFT_927230 [Pavlovales sp. CCMP2436]|nr:hypothetical protein T492DRAFT_927230 [Pavlovales sp. CCMP2436]|mmetsp:Transcript_33257/g.82830  ORF Transcript_33257/g.82830 Transcript_33257/m.82830 type:complete len:363 (-) Transcript_33257:182-1270(-)